MDYEGRILLNGRPELRMAGCS